MPRSAVTDPPATEARVVSYRRGSTVQVRRAGVLAGATRRMKLVVCDVDRFGNLTIAQLGGGRVWRNVAPTTALEHIQV